MQSDHAPTREMTPSPPNISLETPTQSSARKRRRANLVSALSTTKPQHCAITKVRRSDLGAEENVNAHSNQGVDSGTIMRNLDKAQRHTFRNLDSPQACETEAPQIEGQNVDVAGDQGSQDATAKGLPKEAEGSKLHCVTTKMNDDEKLVRLMDLCVARHLRCGYSGNLP